MSLFRKLLRWEGGRQNAGYEKMLLCFAYWPIKFDMYLLRFKVGSEIPPHIDPVTSGKHYRLNIVLKSAIEGGEFICKNPIYETRRIKLFRPDVSEHRVTRIAKGTRYLLSIGWVKNT
jgi:hypothetical protein